jgi:hypothetical protein
MVSTLVLLFDLNRLQGIESLFFLVPASHAFCHPDAMEQEQQVISADRLRGYHNQQQANRLEQVLLIHSF